MPVTVQHFACSTQQHPYTFIAKSFSQCSMWIRVPIATHRLQEMCALLLSVLVCVSPIKVAPYLLWSLSPAFLIRDGHKMVRHAVIAVWPTCPGRALYQELSKTSLS